MYREKQIKIGKHYIATCVYAGNHFQKNVLEVLRIVASPYSQLFYLNPSFSETQSLRNRSVVLVMNSVQ